MIEELLHTTTYTDDLKHRLQELAIKYEWAPGYKTLINSDHTVSVYGRYLSSMDMRTFNKQLNVLEDAVKKLSFVIKDMKDVINRRPI